MKKFKNAIVGSVVAIILYAGSIFAGDITGTGHYWADMYTYLTNNTTITNELKADHNTVYKSYTGTVRQLIVQTNYSAFRNAVRTRGVPVAATSTSDLSLTGL